MEDRCMQLLMADLDRELESLPLAQVPHLLGLLAILTGKAQSKLLSGPTQVVREIESVLTVPQVAQRLNMSSYRVYELCRAGALSSYKCGKSVRVKPSAVAEYLASKG